MVYYVAIFNKNSFLFIYAYRQYKYTNCPLLLCVICANYVINFLIMAQSVHVTHNNNGQFCPLYHMIISANRRTP